ncbi:MAG: TIGR01244 family sulfur transferase [Pseudomonadota bacterium]
MHIRPLTERYAVSPQISAEDIAAAQAAGYTTILCNRPDAEVSPDLQAAEVRTAAEAVGMHFVENPIAHGGMDADMVALQAKTIAEAPGPVLAYCASGTRSTVIWLFGAAAETDPDTLLAAAAKQGYALDTLRPQLEAIHAAHVTP